MFVLVSQCCVWLRCIALLCFALLCFAFVWFCCVACLVVFSFGCFWFLEVCFVWLDCFVFLFVLFISVFPFACFLSFSVSFRVCLRIYFVLSILYVRLIVLTAFRLRVVLRCVVVLGVRCGRSVVAYVLFVRTCIVLFWCVGVCDHVGS